MKKTTLPIRYYYNRVWELTFMLAIAGILDLIISLFN